jgi:TonB family protein
MSKLMPQKGHAAAFFLLLAVSAVSQSSAPVFSEAHQRPDQDGIYYVGPEVTAPQLVRTVSVPYPEDVSDREVQGMTVLAMVIDASGTPAHIQVLHTHGDGFDGALIKAVKRSSFVPGSLAGKPVPVWIDVRAVFRADRSRAVPQVVITERDLTPPDVAQLEDKHHRPLSYTAPFPIHTVDADFADPLSKHPFVQVAVVSVLVSEEGLPKEVRVSRGLGFGLDAKAEAAVWRYRFLPATKNGKPISARREILVPFSKF